MTRHDSPLAVAFLESQPKAAARVLASVDPEDAGAFVDTISADIVAGVLAKMGASAAMSILGEMSPLNAASVLVELDDRDAAAILRLMPDPARVPVFMALPQKLRRDFEKSMSHPLNLVGAKMTTGIAIADDDDTIKDACERLRRLPASGLDVVYIVDNQRRLVGYLSAFDLLRYPSDSRLLDVTIGHVTAVSSHAGLATIADGKHWNDHKALPVINRQRQLIGAILKEDVVDNLDFDTAPDLNRESSIAVTLAIAFVASFVALAELFADLSVGPASQNE